MSRTFKLMYDIYDSQQNIVRDLDTILSNGLPLKDSLYQITSRMVPDTLEVEWEENKEHEVVFIIHSPSPTIVGELHAVLLRIGSVGFYDYSVEFNAFIEVEFLPFDMKDPGYE